MAETDTIVDTAKDSSQDMELWREFNEAEMSVEKAQIVKFELKKDPDVVCPNDIKEIDQMLITMYYKLLAKRERQYEEPLANREQQREDEDPDIEARFLELWPVAMRDKDSVAIEAELCANRAIETREPESVNHTPNTSAPAPQNNSVLAPVLVSNSQSGLPLEGFRIQIDFLQKLFCDTFGDEGEHVAAVLCDLGCQLPNVNKDGLLYLAERANEKIKRQQKLSTLKDIFHSVEKKLSTSVAS